MSTTPRNVLLPTLLGSVFLLATSSGPASSQSQFPRECYDPVTGVYQRTPENFECAFLSTEALALTSPGIVNGGSPRNGGPGGNGNGNGNGNGDGNGTGNGDGNGNGNGNGHTALGNPGNLKLVGRATEAPPKGPPDFDADIWGPDLTGELNGAFGRSDAPDNGSSAASASTSSQGGGPSGGNGHGNAGGNGNGNGGGRGGGNRS